MTSIMIHGMGAMGQHVHDLLDASQSLICFDPSSDSLEVVSEIPDVIIDFSHHSLIVPLLNFAVDRKLPVVLCTTGLTDEVKQQIKTASKSIPVFISGNMSLGIQVLLELAKIGAQKLRNFDIEIIEKHHNKKIDAPSGTAYMIAQAIQDIQNLTLEHHRYGNEAKRGEQVIGIHAIRGGTLCGEHTLLFAGLDETLEITHRATSKRVFAKGAIQAAEFLLSQPPGLYSMTDLLEGEHNEL